ncbi:MAG: hypothetical protein CMM41_09145 [Rhodospirillaceae bacterium]|nr:hypothetical protein [Rhodospirillaceae bacterium]
MQIAISQRLATIAVTLATSLFFVILLWRTFGFAPSMLPGYPGDSFFPRLVIGFGLIWCGVLLFRLFKGSDIIVADDHSEVLVPLRSFSLICFYVLSYVLLLDIIGFEITTFLFVSTLFATRLRGNHSQRLFRTSLISFITTIFCWAIFALVLNVNFPIKFLPNYIDF